MRLVACALSAVLMSGCSWLGFGGNQTDAYNYGYGQQSGAYGCSTGASAYGGQNGYNQMGYGQGQQAGYQGGYNVGMPANGCAAGAYGVSSPYGNVSGMGLRGSQGYGAQGMQGQNAYSQVGGGYGSGANNMYGIGSGMQNQNGMYSQYGAQGTGAQGTGGMYGQNGTGLYGQTGTTNGFTQNSMSTGYGTALNGSAPYGTAVTGQQVPGQYTNGQWVQGAAANVQTVQGSPIYVPQPYPAYYGVGYNAGYAGHAGGGHQGFRGVSSALPFGIGAFIGTEVSIGGDLVGAKPAGLGTGGGANPLHVSATPAISYKDAYKNAINYGLAGTYDLSPSTTVLGQVGYSKASGKNVRVGTLTSGATVEDLYAQWGDLEQFTVEGGIRQYLGGWNNGVTGLRPYVGATGGFTHNNDVSLSQSSTTLMPAGSNVQNFLQAGWNPTASGVIGAEMQVGGRTAIGVETGVRWRDAINGVQEQDSRWSVPVSLRGRVSF